MIWVKLFILTMIGGVIGWATNVIAIKMLFRPFEPIRIPVLGFQIQGLIPKRRTEITKSVAETVESELVSINEIIDRFVTEEKKAKLLNVIKIKTMDAVERKMPNRLPGMLKALVCDFIRQQLDTEGEQMLDEAIAAMTEDLEQEVSIREMIEEKIDAFDLQKIEEIVLRIAKTELRHIELLGGIIGLVIGLIQGLLVLFL